MDAVVVGDFRMEGRRHQRPLLNGDDSTGGRAGANASENVDLLAGLLHPGRANEHGMERMIRDGFSREIKIRLEAVDLTSERVAANRDVETAEGLLPAARVEDPVRQHDHAGAGAQGRQAGAQPIPQWLEDLERHGELGHGGRLAARQNDSVEAVQLGGSPYRPDLGAASSQRRTVFADVALEGKDTDHGSRHKGRVYKARDV